MDGVGQTVRQRNEMTNIAKKIYILGNKYQHWLTATFAILAVVMGAGLAIASSSGNILFVVMGLIAILSTPIFFFRPDLGLYAHALLTYTNLSGVAISHHGVPSITKFFVPYLLGVVFLRWFIWREPFVKGWQQVLNLFFSYLFFYMLSLLYAPDVDEVMHVLDNLTKNMLIAIAIVVLMQSIKNFRYVIWILVISALLISIINTHQGLTGNFDDEYSGFAQPGGEGRIFGETDAVRIAGPIGEPNFFALSLVMIFPLAVGVLVAEDRRILRILAISCIVFILSSIMLTYSRGGFVAIAATLLAMLFFPSFRKISLILILGGIFITPVIAPEGYIDRVFTLSSVLEDQPESLADRSLRGRTSENRAAIDMFLDHIVVGVGVGNYNYHYQDYSENYGLDVRRTQRSAHSLYLEIASEQGLVGLIMFGTLIFYAFKSIFVARSIYINLKNEKFAKLCTAIFISLVGYLTGSIFLHDSFPRYFWLLIGIALSLQGIAIQYHQISHPKLKQSYLESL
jgi:putative inorganic carbon (hco3(-)) transporter